MANAIFLSTPSVRRATFQHTCGLELLPISIHALREEGDGACGSVTLRLFDFYPRPP